MSDETKTPDVPDETPDPAPPTPEATAEATAVPPSPDAAAPEVPTAPEIPAAPEPYHEPRAAAEDSPRPAEPVEEVRTAVADPTLLSESEAAAAKRAETASAVALVAAIAASRAEASAAAAASVEPIAEVAGKRPGKIKALRAVVAMLIRAVLVIALFVGGYALGQAAFRNNQSTATTTIIDPTTDGIEPPAVVREFVGALSSGDADALRSSLQAEPHARLTSEFRRFDIQSINSVETLSTHADGARSATEIVMQGTTTSGVPISINLVVLADGNAIEGFR